MGVRVVVGACVAVVFANLVSTPASASTVAVQVTSIESVTNPVVVGETLTLTLNIDVPVGMTWSPTGSVAVYCPTSFYAEPDCLASSLSLSIAPGTAVTFPAGTHQVGFEALAPSDAQDLFLIEILLENSQPSASLHYMRASTVAVLWPDIWIDEVPEMTLGDTEVIAAPVEPEPEPTPTPTPEPEPTPTPEPESTPTPTPEPESAPVVVPEPAPVVAPAPSPAPAPTPAAAAAPAPAPAAAPSSPALPEPTPPVSEPTTQIENVGLAAEPASTSVRFIKWSAPVSWQSISGFTPRNRMLKSQRLGATLQSEIVGERIAIQYLSGPRQGRFHVYANDMLLGTVNAHSATIPGELINIEWPIRSLEPTNILVRTVSSKNRAASTSIRSLRVMTQSSPKSESERAAR